MKGFSKEHAIPASPSAVFAVLADPSQAQAWQPAVKEVRLLREGKLEKGSTWIETRNTPAGLMVATVEVTEFEPEKTLELSAVSSKARITMRYELEPDGAGTKVRTHAAGRLKGLRFPFSGKLVKQMEASEGDLLQRLEAHVAAAPAKTAKAAKAAKTTAKAAKTTAKAAKGKTAKAATAKAAGAKAKAGASPKKAKA